MYKHLPKQDFWSTISFFHSTSHPSKVYAVISPSCILPFPMQPGQGIIPVDLIIRPLLARSSFSPCLWLTPCSAARITSIYSHSRVYAPKESTKYCGKTDRFRGASYLYCQNLKAICQWQSFNRQSSKTTKNQKVCDKNFEYATESKKTKLWK